MISYTDIAFHVDNVTLRMVALSTMLYARCVLAGAAWLILISVTLCMGFVFPFVFVQFLSLQISVNWNRPVHIIILCLLEKRN